MKKKINTNQINMIMWLLIIVSMIVAFFFCTQKQGFHYDEYYSYYSTNISEGMWLPDGDWRTGDSIAGEFMANEGEPLALDVVRISQSYDVHPPMYYYVLRIVSYVTKGIFSKWQGLGINLVFYLISLVILWSLANLLSDDNPVVAGFSLIITGLSPAVISTVMMVRMYSMLTCECMLVAYVCARALKKKQFDWCHLIIPMLLLSFFGFMTHYYFVIYLFFVAAFMCIYMVIHRETRVKAFILGFGICFGLGVGVLYYPFCYSHIFKGYRGNDATGAFFDMSNTVGRLKFYTEIVNDYALSGAFYTLVLIMILLYLMYRMKSKSKSGKIRVEILLITTICLGYFLVVSKTATALSNPVEALRYHSPVFMLIVLLLVMALYYLGSTLNLSKLIVVLLVLTTGVQIYGLMASKVFFLYKDDVRNYEFARERRGECVVYIYNPDNRWMVWDDSKELMQYNQIFFISIDNADEIADDLIKSCDNMYVYACRGDKSEEIMGRLIETNNNISIKEKCSERLYADIYELK